MKSIFTNLGAVVGAVLLVLGVAAGAAQAYSYHHERAYCNPYAVWHQRYWSYVVPAPLYVRRPVCVEDPYAIECGRLRIKEKRLLSLLYPDEQAQCDLRQQVNATLRNANQLALEGYRSDAIALLQSEEYSLDTQIGSIPAYSTAAVMPAPAYGGGTFTNIGNAIDRLRWGLY